MPSHVGKDTPVPGSCICVYREFLTLDQDWLRRNQKVLFAVSVAGPTAVVGSCGKAHRKTSLKLLPFVNPPGELVLGRQGREGWSLQTGWGSLILLLCFQLDLLKVHLRPLSLASSGP